MKNIGYIYLITCLVNGKFYIGQTRKYSISGVKTGIMTRWKRHVYKAKTMSYDCPKLNNAIRKHGADNFLVTKIISCSLDELDHYETYYIRVYDSVATGYNCSLGGQNFNLSISPEQQKIISKKISDKAKKRWSNPEFREKFNKIKNKSRKAPHLPTNISEQKNKKGIVTGYKVEIIINGIRKTRCFISIKFTLEENLNKAKLCLQEIKKSLK